MQASELEAHRRAQRAWVASGTLPGYAEVLLHRGKVVYFDAHGSADLEAKTPFTDTTLVRLFSMTKPLTVVALMRLVERGRLNLDHSVSKYLPYFRNMAYVHTANQVHVTKKDKRVRNGPTLRQLMVHTSGLSYGSFFGQPPKYACERSYAALVAAVDSGEVQSLDTFCQRLAKLPLRFKPGERWEYSHGVDVLGRVIEVVSGRSLCDFVSAEILGPLGMEDTSFAVPKAFTERLAALYTQPKEGEPGSTLGRLDGGAASAWSEGSECRVRAGGGFMGSTYRTSDGSSSVGGVVSTLQDYSRFVRMVASGGLCPASGKRILRKATVDTFFENWLAMKSVSGGQKRLKGWHDTGRGKMGWGPLGQVRLGDPHAGAIWMGGIAGTFFAIDRKSGVVSLTLTQATEAYDFYGEALWEAGQRAVACSSKRPYLHEAEETSTSKCSRRADAKAHRAYDF